MVAILAGLTLVGVIFLFVLPGRTLLSQQHTIARTSAQISMLTHENAQLRARVAQLRSDTQIEQIARQEYGLVMPGQQAYVIVPSKAGSSAP
ncbi:MAG: FtsB family cell division protein [Acidimicrobiales bacterium]